MINPYTPDEVKRINELSNVNDKHEEYFKKTREEWNEKIEGLLGNLRFDNFVGDNIQKIFDAQAYSNSYMQMITEQISVFMNKLSKAKTKEKAALQAKLIFYSTGFGLKTTNASQMKILIDAHVSEEARACEILETHIEYLRDSRKVLETFMYSVKNSIQLYNYINQKY